jgi:hypothetical protein
MTAPGPAASSLALPVAAALLFLFTLVAGTDGLYFHLYRYRLHRRPASRFEHLLHTANALLFPPMTVLLFCFRPEGAYLWLALFLFLGTVVLESVDVFCEKQSRADLGGLTPLEYWMHFLMSGLRWGMAVPLFVMGPAGSTGPGGHDYDAYRLSATALHPRPFWFFLIGCWIVVPSIGAAALHVVLCFTGRRNLAVGSPSRETPGPLTSGLALPPR